MIEYLCNRFSYHSKVEWQEKLDSCQLHLNGKSATGTELLEKSMVLEYFPNEYEEPKVDFNSPIIYEDEFLFAVNKSGNLPVHPAGPYFNNTLWSALRKERNEEFFFFHRLDRETSGVILIGKSSESIRLLNLTNVIKEYQALVFGEFPDEFMAVGYLENDTTSEIRKKQRFVLSDNENDLLNKKQAISHFFCDKRFKLPDNRVVSLLRAYPKTGRFHQIRATLYSLGYPLLGDKLYGPNDKIYLKQREESINQSDKKLLILPRQALHASKLKFIHPYTKEALEISAPMPKEFII